MDWYTIQYYVGMAIGVIIWLAPWDAAQKRLREVKRNGKNQENK